MGQAARQVGARILFAAAVLATPRVGEAAGEADAIRIHGPFPAASPTRWAHVRVDLHNSAAAQRQGTVLVRRASGAVERRDVSVAPLERARVVEYLYEGGPDPVQGVEAVLGAERASWERPEGIPPRLVVVAVTADAGRLTPVRALLTRQDGVGVVQVPPTALPDRWLAWRGVAAAVVWADEQPPALSDEGRALLDYLATGGTVLLYGGAGGDALFGDAADGDVAGRRGLLYRMGPGRTSPPELREPPGAPRSAPLLVQTATAAPVGWMAGRAALFLPMALLALWALRRRPRVGLAAGALAALLAAAPMAPEEPASVREARWSGEDGTSWREVELLPERTGPVRVPAEEGERAAVVALDPADVLDIQATADGGFTVGGRWGEPVRVLVEAVARADRLDRP